MSVTTPGIVQTPVFDLPGRGWSRLVVKDESQQLSGAFKFRGNHHKLQQLPLGTHVVAASTGNHAAGLATANAGRLPVTVYVPATTPRAKLDRIAAAGAEAVLIEGGYDDCELEARAASARTGAVFVHSFDDTDLIDGHRTLFREVERQSGLPDVAFVPVGGGGLITAALREWGARVRIVGVEYDQAPAMQRSLAAGERITLDSALGMPEGLLVRRVGEIAFRTCQEHHVEIVLVGDADLRRAMKVLWSDSAIRAEGAGAAALAAALISPDADAHALGIVSGGNINRSLWDEWVQPS
jgi:threonine dehydratase